MTHIKSSVTVHTHLVPTETVGTHTGRSASRLRYQNRRGASEYCVPTRSDRHEGGEQLQSSEITPEHIYLSRRQFMVGVGAIATTAILNGCGDTQPKAPLPVEGNTTGSTTDSPPVTPHANAETDELGDPLNSFYQITNYNNFYEFTTDKEGVARMSEGFQTDPWSIEVGGLVNKPQTFSIDDIWKKFPEEERIYRLRCVEAWSMVIPWLGFPLSALLKQVEPTSSAKYVRFETLHDPARFPGQNSRMYNWPYVEGLRLDEAMHDLTILSTGLYGKRLLPQSGAPIRLVVPWKYGFKSIKSIVRIELVEEMPLSLWMFVAPGEYGFYANVNPDVDHPRWSQASERRISEWGRRQTSPFNGYAEQVAHLYEGMDLQENF